MSNNINFGFIAIVICCLLPGCSPESEPSRSISLQQALAPDDSTGYLFADQPREFSFPEDHGAHNGFRNEWWYITGNLKSDQGQPFGFQVTFFRIALKPQPDTARPSNWASNHIWMAHVALTDPTRQKHIAAERFSREAVGLAGTQKKPFKVWVGDWRIISESEEFPWQLNVNADDFQLTLNLAPITPATLQGEQGLSQKGEEKGNASYYYSISRLKTAGTIIIDKDTYDVSGLSWLDREWSSGALGPDQVGWDWFSMQLHDGTDIMFYHLRTRSGVTDDHSAGSIVNPDKVHTVLQNTDIVLTPIRWWQSKHGANYPVAWTIDIKPLKKQWQVEALLDQQEMALSVSYWEGMVSIKEDGEIIGNGYLEMTGY